MGRVNVGHPNQLLTNVKPHVVLLFGRCDVFVPNEEDNYKYDDVTAIFCVSTLQYISMVVIFSRSAPYRLTIFSNCKMSSAIIIIIILFIPEI